MHRRPPAGGTWQRQRRERLRRAPAARATTVHRFAAGAKVALRVLAQAAVAIGLEVLTLDAHRKSAHRELDRVDRRGVDGKATGRATVAKKGVLQIQLHLERPPNGSEDRRLRSGAHA